MTNWWAASFLVATLSTAPAICAEPPPSAPLQSHTDFEAAFRDESSAPYYVMLTVVDDRTGQATTGCPPAPLFLGGMSLEMWGRYDPRTTPDAPARREAVLNAVLANTSHVFHFSKQEALDNFFPFRHPEACAVIAQGKRVRSADINGQLWVGPFTDGPGLIRSSCPPVAFPLEDKLATQGGVGVSFMVAADGKISDITLTQTSGSPVLDQVVLKELPACKFKPRAIDDVPVPGRFPATFFLNNRSRWPFAAQAR